MDIHVDAGIMYAAISATVFTVMVVCCYLDARNICNRK